MGFSDLGLSPEVLNAIADAGYVEPTPIQREAIPYVLMTRDVLGCAQTGTGKTASFTLPMIDILSSGRAKARMPRSLILTPTRELAAQIAENFEVYGKYCKLTMALLIGGVSMDEQTKKLDRGVDVLIATPGRLLDHFERGRILLNDIKILVIDEADRMLDMGFIPDVERIVALLPRIRQTLFFSATMPPEIRRLSEKFLSNPKEITVAPQSRPAAETVTQGLAIVEDEDKREALRRILRKENVASAIIFCNRKRDVDILYKSLAKHGFNAGRLHGDMDQSTRNETLERFKRGEIGLLVASDVAARGLDVDDLPFVFNFDVPIHSEDYIHRIGRTGRAGRSGSAFTLASPADGPYVDSIEKLLGNQIPRIEVDGIEAASLEEGGRRRGRGRRGAKGGKPEAKRGDRPASRRSETEKAPAAEKPQAADIAAAAEPVPVEKEPRPRAERERSRPARDMSENPHAGASRGGNPPRNAGRGRNRRRDRDNDDDNVVGLGDHVPAFLLKPARRSAS
jgi:superfamily II DNA/RNA helicase